MLSYRNFTAIIVIALALFSGACTTSVIKPHPSVLNDEEQNAAIVYFLRPAPTRTRGVADSDVQIEFDEKLAALLSSGEYIALKVKPGKTEITLRSYTYLTSKPMPIIVHRATEFEFEAGKRYLIHTKFTQEEFRGIYFTPEEIDLTEAKQYLKRLQPHGALAKAHPLSSL